jgi:hypothetical protein
VDAVFRQVMFRQVMFPSSHGPAGALDTRHSRPELRPCPQHFDRLPRRCFKTGPAGTKIGDDRIPGYDASRTGEVSNVSDVIG